MTETGGGQSLIMSILLTVVHDYGENSLLLIELPSIFGPCQPGQGHHNSICQLQWALLPNPPCQLSLWDETGVPGENPRPASFGRALTFYSFHMRTGFESH